MAASSSTVCVFQRNIFNTWTRCLVKHTCCILKSSNPAFFKKIFVRLYFIQSVMGGTKKTLGWACILKGITSFVINALYTLYYQTVTSSLRNGKYYSYKEIYFGFDLLFVHILFLCLLYLYVGLNGVKNSVLWDKWRHEAMYCLNGMIKRDIIMHTCLSFHIFYF